MKFRHSFLRRHLAGKPVVASPNVGCFLRLAQLNTRVTQFKRTTKPSSTQFKSKTITFRPAVELIALAKNFFLCVFQSNFCSVQTSQVELLYLGETSLCCHSFGISNTVFFPLPILFPIHRNFLPFQFTRNLYSRRVT